eukprot:scaffold2274_cov21-Tisochrysis_lutea.AAC.5
MHQKPVDIHDNGDNNVMPLQQYGRCSSDLRPLGSSTQWPQPHPPNFEPSLCGGGHRLKRSNVVTT